MKRRGMALVHVHAADWPHWRGPAFNGSSSETNLPANVTVKDNVKWKAPLPGFSGATPIISGDAIFVASPDPNKNLLLLCFDRKDGKVRWQKQLAVGDISKRGTSPNMTDLLLRRAADVAPAARPAETTLFIVGHGTDLNDNSAAAAKREVERIRATGKYAEVFNAYMEEEPLISRWHEIASQPDVVVVPFFIADGLHSYQDIPVLLGIQEEAGAAASESQVFRRNPYRIRGRMLHYANAIGTEPLFADLILDQVRSFDEEHAVVAV